MTKRHTRPIAFIVFAVVICISVVLDRITKHLAALHLQDGAIQPFIPGVLDFRLVYNIGAAWGILQGAQTVFIIVASFTLVAMVIYLAVNRRHAAGEVIALGLIAGGAIGNGIDRALGGQVVDFIHPLFINFPLFNLADSAITIGAILFILTLLIGYKKAKPAPQPDSHNDKDVTPSDAGDNPPKAQDDAPA